MKNTGPFLSVREKFLEAKKHADAGDTKKARELLAQIEKIELEAGDEKSFFALAKSLREKLAERKKKKQLQAKMGGLLTIIILVSALLVLIKMPSTMVDIQVEASRFSFKLAKDWTLFSIPAKAIGISHAEDIIFDIAGMEKATHYDDKTDQPDKWEKIDTAGEIRLSGHSEDWRLGISGEEMRLSTLKIIKGTQITVLQNPKNLHEITFFISKGKVMGQIDTGEFFILSCINGRIENLPGKLDDMLRIESYFAPLTFRDKAGKLNLTLELAAGGKQDFSAAGLSVSEIDFTTRSAEKRISTIRKGGIIHFAELDNASLKFREDDFLSLGELSQFQVRKLSIEKHLKLQLQGRVGELKSGARGFLYSRMPSLLQWLYVNPVIAILLTVILSVFGTLWTIFSRLKII